MDHGLVDVLSTEAVRAELENRGGAQGGLITIILVHLQEKEKQSNTEFMTEHQQGGEPLPFAVAVSSLKYPGVILVTTYEEAVRDGFYDSSEEIKQ